jgi:hypothetical protein
MGILFGTLFIIFLILKLTGVINWSWWWVIAPLFIGILLWVITFVSYILFFGVLMCV